jgi:hypothetical protein
VNYSLRNDIKITDPDALKETLGKRFGDLVKTDVSYKPEPKLLDMIVDGDDDLGKQAAKAFTFKSTQAVSFRAAVK